MLNLLGLLLRLLSLHHRLSRSSTPTFSVVIIVACPGDVERWWLKLCPVPGESLGPVRRLMVMVDYGLLGGVRSLGCDQMRWGCCRGDVIVMLWGQSGDHLVTVCPLNEGGRSGSLLNSAAVSFRRRCRVINKHRH